MMIFFLIALFAAKSECQYVYADRGGVDEQRSIDPFSSGGIQGAIDQGFLSRSPFGPDVQAFPGQPLPGRPEDIHKHIFAYVAPDDTAPEVVRIPDLPKPGVHYKILFIKAPTSIPPRIELPSLSVGPDIRTLVYVLQPRPSQIPVPEIRQPPSVKPAQPQVFFIRYNPRAPRFGRQLSNEESSQPENEAKKI